MSALFHALLSAQYHATKSMASAGKLPGADGWLERVNRREGRASRILRPLARVEEAAGVIRACRPKGANEQRTWRHARAALAAAHVVNRRQRTRIAQPPGLTVTLDAVLPGGTRSLERRLEHDGDVWSAFAHGYAADPPGKARIVPFKLHVNSAQLDDSDVTIFDAQVTRETSGVTISEIARKCDPRKWDQTFPDLFAQSYLLPAPPTCPDRYVDPSPIAAEPLAETGFDGYLFEEATLGFIGRFRNILKMKLSSSAKAKDKAGRVDITYSLHEPLSNDVFGVRQPGGFDVDSSDKSNPCTIRLEPDKRRGKPEGAQIMTTRASKKMRFSEYAEFAEELNLFALPLLNIWVTSLLVNSVYI